MPTASEQRELALVQAGALKLEEVLFTMPPFAGISRNDSLVILGAANLIAAVRFSRRLYDASNPQPQETFSAGFRAMIDDILAGEEQHNHTQPAQPAQT